MLAFVLSGGANRGAIEVGALQSLLEHDILPDLVVGTSAGALNGAYFCLNPTVNGVEALAQIWLDTTRRDVFPGNVFTWALRALLGRDGLVSHRHLLNYARRQLGRDDITFGDMEISLFVTTTDLLSAQLVVFGEDKNARALEPAVASAAYPLVIDPLLLDGRQLTDGGVVAFAPVKVAAQQGASEAYVIDLSAEVPRSEPAHGLIDIGTQVLETALRKGRLDDMQAAIDAGVSVHHVRITAFADISIFDFSQTREMIAAGKAAMDDYLRLPSPNTIHRPAPAVEPPAGGRFVRDGYNP